MKINAAIQHMDRLLLTPQSFHSESTLEVLEELPRLKYTDFHSDAGQRRLARLLRNSFSTLKLTLRLRDSIQTDALSTTSSSREPSKDVEEPTEPTVALVHTSPPTATLNSTASRPVVR